MIWLLAFLGMQYIVHRYGGPNDPGDENDHPEEKTATTDVDGFVHHPFDGWPYVGCTCPVCVELRTRPVGQYQQPDEESLLAGLSALEHYQTQQKKDGDYGLLDQMYEVEQQNLTALRAELLNKAANSEARSQRVVGSGDTGVL